MKVGFSGPPHGADPGILCQPGVELRDDPELLTVTTALAVAGCWEVSVEVATAVKVWGPSAVIVVFHDCE